MIFGKSGYKLGQKLGSILASQAKKMPGVGKSIVNITKEAKSKIAGTAEAAAKAGTARGKVYSPKPAEPPSANFLDNLTATLFPGRWGNFYQKAQLEAKAHAEQIARTLGGRSQVSLGGARLGAGGGRLGPPKVTVKRSLLVDKATRQTWSKVMSDVKSTASALSFGYRPTSIGAKTVRAVGSVGWKTGKWVGFKPMVWATNPGKRGDIVRRGLIFPTAAGVGGMYGMISGYRAINQNRRNVSMSPKNAEGSNRVGRGYSTWSSSASTGMDANRLNTVGLTQALHNRRHRG